MYSREEFQLQKVKSRQSKLKTGKASQIGSEWFDEVVHGMMVCRVAGAYGT